MKIKTAATLSIMLIIAVSIWQGVMFVHNYMVEEEPEEQQPLFAGPVPEGYDEEYFRKTGITKKLEVED